MVRSSGGRWLVPLLLAYVLLSAGCTKAEVTATSTTSSAPPSTSPASAPASTVAASTTAPSSTSAVATKAAFLKQGNAICRAEAAKLAALSSKYGPSGPSTPADTADLIEQNAQLLEQNVADFRALPVPPGDEDTIEALNLKILELVAYAREFAKAKIAGDEQLIATLTTQAKAVQTEIDAAADTYGLTDCSGGS